MYYNELVTEISFMQKLQNNKKKNSFEINFNIYRWKGMCKQKNFFCLLLIVIHIPHK